MKEKILQQALQLFNEHGVSTVTARMICDQLKISLGSYSYHFPDKKKITSSLYLQLVSEIEAVYQAMQGETPTILTYLESHRRLFLIQEQYKFFYLNLVEILATNEEVKALYQNRRAEEKQLAHQVFHYYMGSGILKKDTSEAQIERLIDVGQILNDFWPIDAAVSPTKAATDRLVHYMKICCGLLEPFLEVESHEAYHQYFKQLQKTT